MSPRDSQQARKLSKAAVQQLAYGGSLPPGGGGGGSRAVAAAAPGSPDPTLTEKFNRATKGPVLHNGKSGPDYKKQIDLLRRQMSQPKHTLEMTPTGSVTRGINQQKDKLLVQSIAALTKQMSNDNKQQQKLGMAARKGDAKRAFNQAAKGLGR